MKKVNSNTVMIGILLAALASACAPKVRTAPATPEKKEEAAATGTVTQGSQGKVQMLDESEQVEWKAIDEVTRTMLIQANALRYAVEKKEQVECVQPRPGQIRLLEKTGNLQVFELDITCLKAISADESSKGNNEVIRVSIGGTMDSETKLVEFESEENYDISEGSLDLSARVAK